MNHRPPLEDTMSVTCREVAACASEYLEEHLPDRSKVRMARHLAACAACVTYVEQIRLVRETLKHLPGSVPSFELRRSLQGRFARR